MSFPESSPATNPALTILMVDSHAEVERGGAVQCASLALELARRGHRVTCVFDGPADRPMQGQTFSRLREAGVTLLRLPLDSPRGILAFRRRLRSLAPDILHTHKNRALLFAYFATWGQRRPVWVTNRGTIYSLAKNPLARYVHRRHVHAMVAVSEAVRRVLIEDGIAPARVHTVFGSFDPERFHPGVDGGAHRRAWGITGSGPVVGMVASLRTPKKGHPVFLQAAARIAARLPEVRYVLVGDGDPAPLRREAQRLGLGDRVIFAGFTEDVPGALAALDVVVCASLRGEGLTGAVREALAMARPVVSTDVAGNRELVIPEQTCFLVPPGDPAALAGAVEAFLASPETARTLGLAGRDKVLSCCTREVRAERVEALYRELLEPSRVPGPRAAAQGEES